METQKQPHGAEFLGPREDTVIIETKLKQSRGLMDRIRTNWKDLSEIMSNKSDQFRSWLSSFRKVEELAPDTARVIQQETAQILQPTADALVARESPAIRARKEVVFPSPEEIKALEEEVRKKQAIKDITEEASEIDLQESNGISIETFTDAAGYRCMENPAKRENQDYVETTQYGSVTVDGMGGYADGRKAARAVGESFMEGLKAVKTAHEQHFKNAMRASGRRAQERMQEFAGKEITGGAMVATKVLETLPDGSKKFGVAWSGDVWAAVIAADGKIDTTRETVDHSALNDLYEIRREKDPTKQDLLLDKFAETIANNDRSPNTTFEQKKQMTIPLIKNWISMSDESIKELAPKLRMVMTHSINNQEKDLRIDTQIWTLEPGESMITLTDGYTDVLKLPEDIERAIKVAKATGQPVMEVLTKFYTQALGKGKPKLDNIGGTYTTVEIPEFTLHDVEEKIEDEWDRDENTQTDFGWAEEKTNPFFRIPLPQKQPSKEPQRRSPRANG